jgi:1-deoxyxylulose-5-phosphate synthase
VVVWREWQAEPTKRLETDLFGEALYSNTAEADKKAIERLDELAKGRGLSRAVLARASRLTSRS